MHACLFFSPITKIDHTTQKPSAWYIKDTQDPSKIQKGIESMWSKFRKKWITMHNFLYYRDTFVYQPLVFQGFYEWVLQLHNDSHLCTILASLYLLAAFCILCHLLLLMIPTAVNSSATTRHGEACALAIARAHVVMLAGLYTYNYVIYCVKQ